MYTIQRFGVSKKFNVFEKSFLCSPKLHLFDQKYRNSHIVTYYYNLKELFSVLKGPYYGFLKITFHAVCNTALSE